MADYDTNSADEDFFDEKEGGEEPSDIPIGKREIIFASPQKTIRELYTAYKEGELIVRPEFQRRFVWNIKDASRLIESILLDVPIPMIYSAEEKDSKEIIVDGQQRLISIFSFIDGIFPLENKTFWLRGLETLNELNGLKFNELSEENKKKIWKYFIPFTIIKKQSHEEIKFNVFERLNKGSVKLNDQELRNCTYRGEYNNLLRNLSEYKDFQFILNNPRLHSRMLDNELILRFFAFYHTPYWEYKSPMKQFLNREIIKHRNLDIKEAEKLRDVFKKSVESVKSIFGNRAFRRYVPGKEKDTNGGYELSKLNKGLCDVLMFGFTQYAKNQVIPFADAIREELLYLSTYDLEFVDAISGTGTDNTEKMHIKFKKWADSLKELLQDTKTSQRTFSVNLKRQIFDDNPICAICNQSIMTLDDSEIDHIEFYWRGGKTTPSNARLVHRFCNRSRKWKQDPSKLKDSEIQILEKERFSDKKEISCTLQEEYTIPILETLHEMGGRGKIKFILERIGEKMQSKFSSDDIKKLRGGSLRWENAACWQRLKMIKESLLKGDSPRGIWEITEIGKKYLANQKI